MKDAKNQGSALVVIIVVLSVTIVGVLGYVGWNSFLKSKPTQTIQEQPSANAEKKTEDSNKSYFVLDEWGVKFKIPEGLSTIKYYKVNGYDSYELTTSRVEDLGDDCKYPPVDEVPGVIRLAGINRSMVKKEEFASSEPANNNEPINGYYYVISAAQSTCAYTGGDIQKSDRDAIYEMLKSPIAL